MDSNLQKTEEYIKISPGLGYNNRKLAKLVDFTGRPTKFKILIPS